MMIGIDNPFTSIISVYKMLLRYINDISSYFQCFIKQSIFGC